MMAQGRLARVETPWHSLLIYRFDDSRGATLVRTGLGGYPRHHHDLLPLLVARQPEGQSVVLNVPLIVHQP